MKSGFKVYWSAAIFSDVNTVSFDLRSNKYTQEKDNCLQNCLCNAKDDSRDNPMKVMFNAGATIQVLPFGFGERFPLTETAQKVRSASGADSNVFGRPRLPLIFTECPGCRFIATFT